MENNISASPMGEPPTKRPKVWSYSKDAQQIIIDSHSNLLKESEYGSITRTSSLLNVSRKTVSKIVANGIPKSPKKCGRMNRRFNKIDSFTKDLLRRIIYKFYDKKMAPTLTWLCIS